ncbi:MAG: FTR1 family protein [Lysobacter sp.]
MMKKRLHVRRSGALLQLWLLATLLVLAFAPVAYAQSPGQEAAVVWRLLDYIAVDYAGAVQDGTVINPAEYAEMQEFATTASEKIVTLPANARKSELREGAAHLIELIEGHASPDGVARQARSLATTLVAAYPVPLAPSQPPDVARGAALYQQMCTACHGVTGAGDGPAAAGMDPPPIDFTDEARARERSLFGLYQVITQGLEGTAMTSYAHLSDQDRWALAFHVGQFAYPAEEAPELPKGDANPIATLQELVQITPATLANEVGEQQARAITAFLRRHPAASLPATDSQLSLAHARLSNAVAAYARGDRPAAKSAALSAYLDGFEPVEPQLATRAPDLMRDIEQSMLSLRASIDQQAGLKEVKQRAATTAALLDEAETVLSSKAGNAGWAGFVGALTILVREGLEALLIVIAIVAFLRKAERPDVLPYVHAGWIGALLAGAGTWALATYAVSISGAQREVVEGFSALFAAVVLVSVGLWLHQKSYAGLWQRYLQQKLSRVLSGRSAWFLLVLSFVAVYREVFETILFYSAMWHGGGDNSMILAGFGVGVVILVIVALGMLRFSRKLPIGQFFFWSSLLMAILAVVLTGKGVAALQEAGWLSVAPISFPRIDWLGVHPSLQVVLAQAITLLVLTGGLIHNRRTAVAVKG